METFKFTISELDIIMDGLVLKETQLNELMDNPVNSSDLFCRPSILNELSVLSIIKKKIFHYLIGG
jgi:hypothetical protein